MPKNKVVSYLRGTTENARLRLLLFALVPVSALAGQVHSSMEVSAQVVRGGHFGVTRALIKHVERVKTLRAQGFTGPFMDGQTACEKIANLITDDVWVTCRWEPVNQLYLVTLHY